MAEKLFRDADDHDVLHQPAAAAVTPGKSTLTSRMSSGRPSQVVFRVESAEAAQVFADRFGPRDANGVAEGADEHVAHAGSSSGSALPGDLRERFEESLDTDLSSVRVHTGSASATAASAVGAKAYAVGSDIHFGQGQYDPASTAGQFLIAHEVAHTVQQAGAAPTRQNKLEVSSPADAAESEADRAAGAMIRGDRFSLVSSDVQHQRKLAREPMTTTNDGNYQTIISGGEEASQAAQQAPYEGTEAYLDVSNKGDIGAAERLLSLVHEGSSELVTAQQTDTASQCGQMLAQNKTAQVELENYIDAANRQDVMQQQFAPELQRTNEQYARLEGMYKSACDNLGVKSDTTNFDAKRGSDIVKAGGAYEFDAAKQVKEQAVYTGPGTQAESQAKNSEIIVCKANISRITQEVMKLPPLIGEAAGELKTSHAKCSAAAQKVALPPPTLQQTDDQKQQAQQITKAKAELDAAVAILNTAASLAATGFKAIPVGGTSAGPKNVPGKDGGPVDVIDDGISNTPGKHGNGTHFPEPVKPGVTDLPNTKGAPGDVEIMDKAMTHMKTGGSLVSAVADVKFDFVEGVADVMTNYTAKVASAQKMIDAITDANTKASIQAAADTLSAEEEEFANKLKKLRRLRTEFELGKEMLRTQTEKLMTLIDGNRRKDGKGPDFGMVIAFQTEATIFVAQCDSAIEVGKVERNAARQVNPNVKRAEKNDKVQSHNITNSANRGSPYWSAVKDTRMGDKRDKPLWLYTRNTVHIADQAQGTMDERMDTLMDMLQGDKVKVQAFQAKLSAATGI
jgi:hypothetical protein